MKLKITKLNNKITLGASLLVALATAATAANVIVNGSFESSTTPITTGTGTQWGDKVAGATLSNWSVTDTGGIIALANGTDVVGTYYTGNGTTIPNAYAREGLTFITTNGQNTLVLTQTILGLTAGTLNISYEWINQSHGSAGNGVGGPLRVEIFDGNSDTASSLWDNTVTNLRAARNVWNSVTSGPLTNTGSDVFVRLTLTDSNEAGQTSIDNFVVDFVPEPSSALLSSIGMLLLLRRRR